MNRDSLLTLTGTYALDDQRIAVAIDVDHPVFDPLLNLYKCTIISDELYEQPMIISNSTADQAISSALQVIGITLSYRLSELYRRDLLDMV